MKIDQHNTQDLDSKITVLTRALERACDTLGEALYVAADESTAAKAYEYVKSGAETTRSNLGSMLSQLRSERPCTIEITKATWDLFRELVQAENKYPWDFPFAKEENPNTGLNALTRRLIVMVYNSDSISQAWNPGHRVWNLLRELTKKALDEEK